MTSAVVLEQYLANPPYYGRSHPRDSAAVKALCGPTRKFDYERKLWATRCTDALRGLVASKKWQPLGIHKEANAPLMRAADVHRANAEAAWLAEQAAKTARDDAERKKKAVADAILMSKRKAREAQAAIAELKAKRQKTQAKAASAPAPASVPAVAHASWRQHPPKKKERDGIEPTDAEVAECARLGFTAHAITYSTNCNELGPRGTLSDEGRVLRWCSQLGNAEDERTDNELNREQRRRSWNYEQRWPLPEEASREYATTLNEQAAQSR